VSETKRRGITWHRRHNASAFGLRCGLWVIITIIASYSGRGQAATYLPRTTYFFPYPAFLPTMVPSPLLPYHVQLILQYIVPPSELEQPIPSHLLSRQLLQRHVFLEIQPTDSPSYLSRDPSSRDRAISLLESVRKPFDDLESPLPVAYLADRETAFAHVHLRSLDAEGLRLVFEWDASDASWKYHDVGLMPFPVATRPTLDNSDTPSVSDEREVSPDDPVSPQSLSDDEDNSYWNSYTAPDDEQAAPVLRVINADKDDADDEDAYWAQYSSVQGTLLPSHLKSPPFARPPLTPSLHSCQAPQTRQSQRRHVTLPAALSPHPRSRSLFPRRR
jgi:hypothetical protein